MHISEGVLSAPVLLAGGAMAVAGTAMGLRSLARQGDERGVVRTALAAAAFFVASLIHVPIGPAQAHLILNGLVGIMLGWAAFPAILAGLALQAVLFQFGGLTALGVNLVDMALPAVAVWYACRWTLRSANARTCFAGAFAAGFLGVAGAALLTALALALSGEAFLVSARILVVAHLPVMLVEGLITGFAVGFLARVRPEMLGLEAMPGGTAR